MSHARSMGRVHERLREKQGEPVLEHFGNVYPCTVNRFSRRTALEVGGQAVEADITFFVAKDFFLGVSDQLVSTSSGELATSDNRRYPASGQKVSFCGRVFRIEAVDDALPNELGTPLQLVCVSVTR